MRKQLFHYYFHYYYSFQTAQSAKYHGFTERGGTETVLPDYVTDTATTLETRHVHFHFPCVRANLIILLSLSRLQISYLVALRPQVWITKGLNNQIL